MPAPSNKLDINVRISVSKRYIKDTDALAVIGEVQLGYYRFELQGKVNHA
jgi:hypothetical protein